MEAIYKSAEDGEEDFIAAQAKVSWLHFNHKLDVSPIYVYIYNI